MAQRDNMQVQLQGETILLDSPQALAQSLVLQTIPAVRRWNRIEGRPRARDFDQAIKAEIRDPLWNICKQWQVGEFIGEDAGSPTQASIHIEQSPFTQFGAGTNVLQPFSDEEPLEMRVERQPLVWSFGDRKMSFDLRLMLGRRWHKMLANAGLDTQFSDFRDAYPIDLPDRDDPVDADIVAHSIVNQRVAAVSGRMMDGGALFLFLKEAPGNAASDGIADLTPPQVAAIDSLGDPFVQWVQDLLEQPDENQDGWHAERLEYSAQITTEPEGGPQRNEDETLVASEIYDGRLDWYHFDREPDTQRPAPDPLTEDPVVFLPTPLDFDGMPHPRWWQFEQGETNFGAIDPATSDIGKLMFLEHVLLYANDWFIFPYRVRAGSNALVRGLSVTNVFGERFWITAAGSKTTENWQGWGVFANNSTDDVNDRSDHHITVLPTTAKIQDAEMMETQWLIRDEMANQVWAIEKRVRTASGQYLRGAELAMETRRFFQARIGPPEPALDSPTDAVLQYELMTRVPENWIPFTPVHKDGDNRQTKLQRAAMPRVLEGDILPPVRVRPRTALMRRGLSDTPRSPYFVENEEVPRAGVQVHDGFRRTRWYGGKTFVWRGIQKRVGRGEGSSGLTFDDLLPKAAEAPAETVSVPPVGHPPLEVVGDPPPQIGITAHPDTATGWNLEISLSNFTLAPENASTAPVDGEGHLHLYVNNVKITRVYGHWYHIPALLPGTHQIKMELSANSHAPLAKDGVRISATTEIEQLVVPPHMHPMGEEDATGPNAPGIMLMNVVDPMSGYNLQSMLENFTITPNSTGSGHVAGEGHLHLYVNDTKVGRVYSEWFHLPNLGAGVHKIKMALFTNDHRPYFKDGAPIASEIEVTVVGGGALVGQGHLHP